MFKLFCCWFCLFFVLFFCLFVLVFVYISSTHILSACFIWPFVFVCFCFCSIKSLIFYSGIWADFCPMGHVGVDRLVTYHAYAIDCAGVSLLVHDLMLLDIFPWARWEIVIAAWSDYWFSFFDLLNVEQWFSFCKGRYLLHICFNDSSFKGCFFEDSPKTDQRSIIHGPALKEVPVICVAV